MTAVLVEGSGFGGLGYYGRTSQLCEGLLR